MKKVVMALFFMSLFVVCANAQQPAAAAKPRMTKEEKTKQKQTDEEEKAAIYKPLGLTAEQTQQMNNALAECDKGYLLVKKDASLTEDEKKVKFDETVKARDEKLKAIMGADKFKQFIAIRKQLKQQKQAAR